MASGHQEAAVDVQYLPCDIVGFRSAEEADHICHVFRFAAAFQRNVHEECVARRLRKLFGHIRDDVSGSDRIRADVAAAELARRGLGQSDHAGFGGGVVRLSGVAILPTTDAMLTIFP